MPRLVYKAIVLHSEYIFEIDREVILFTRERGKLRTIGRGGAKIPNRFGASITPFSVVEATIWESWKGGLTLETTELITPGFSLLSDPGIYPFLSALQEILLEILPENVPREKIFRLLETTIPLIRKNPSALSFYILFWTLKLEGFPVERKISSSFRKQLRTPPTEFSRTNISPRLLISLLSQAEYFLGKRLNSLIHLKAILKIS